ncbi:hypothetical protein EDD22DRAFT_263714 [Suillus occidentalis]|nr:hypothetical protein EDD22DRAFT_263714 [Suillus occidentalis]
MYLLRNTISALIVAPTVSIFTSLSSTWTLIERVTINVQALRSDLLTQVRSFSQHYPFPAGDRDLLLQRHHQLRHKSRLPCMCCSSIGCRVSARTLICSSSYRSTRIGLEGVH